MAANFRIIARMDVKGPDLIKGVHLEGVRKLGNPRDFARRYYAEGIDEIIYIDAVASLYGRNNLTDIVHYTASEVFIPITVGGGVRSVEDTRALLTSGADKVAVNTEATLRPELITEIAERFGSQCMVLSIQAKKRRDGSWEAYRDYGREHTGLDVIEWVKEGQERGAGEILVTSIDQDGTRNGFDLELMQAVSSVVNVPVIASGGMGKTEHIKQVNNVGKVDAVALASVLHYKNESVINIRNQMSKDGISVRSFTPLDLVQ